MKIKIIADSTCDLPKDYLAAQDITIAPLTVVKGDQQFKDGVTIQPGDIFDHVNSGGDLCSTAAVSIGEYTDLFEQFSADYDAIIVINLGSGFSSCYQNACVAAEDFPNVRCIDSRNLTSGQGLLVMEACRLGKLLDDIDAIVDALNAYTARIETSFLIEKLDYLVKGGRCSSAAALGANLLNLKPCIELKDCKMTVGKKYRGSLSKCQVSYITERLQNREDIDHTTAIIVHTQLPEESLSLIRQTVQACGNFETILESVAGSTISCHCGPGTMGIIFARK